MNQEPLAAAATREGGPAEASKIDIDQLPVPDSWKSKFKAIQKAGGPRLPHFRQLTFKERMSAYFNILAGLFGPFYYIAKGMWRKGLALFALCFTAVVLLGAMLDALGYGSLSQALGYGAAAVYAARANIDYYKKMVLKDNGWW